MTKRKTLVKNNKKNRRTTGKNSSLKIRGGTPRDFASYIRRGIISSDAKITGLKQQKKERDEKDRREYEEYKTDDDAIRFMEESIKKEDVISTNVITIYEEIKKKLDNLSNSCAVGTIRNAAIISKIKDLNIELNALNRDTNPEIKYIVQILRKRLNFIKKYNCHQLEGEDLNEIVYQREINKQKKVGSKKNLWQEGDSSPPIIKKAEPVIISEVPMSIKKGVLHRPESSKFFQKWSKDKESGNLPNLNSASGQQESIEVAKTPGEF